MSRLRKVVWHEGMQLDPHHFQQENRYFNALLQTQNRLLEPFFWGVSSIEFDTEALSNGQVALTSCSGIMPDGLVFSMPKDNPLPPAESIEEHFPTTKEKISVYLAIRSEKEGEVNCQLDANGKGDAARFNLEEIRVRDENVFEEPHSVGVARANFQIKFEDESLNDFSSIKIAEIKAPSGGVYSLNNDFIPPCLVCSASEKLQNDIRDLLYSMTSACNNLKEKIPFGKEEFPFVGVEKFSKLKTMSKHIALLNHLYRRKNTHPETIYRAILALGGELTALSENSNHFKAADFPEYDQQKLTQCFGELYRRVSIMVKEKKQDVMYEEMRLQAQLDNPSLFFGELTEMQLAAPLYLGVRGDLPENRIVNDLPENIKIASQDEIFTIVAAGLKGCTLGNVLTPPEELPELTGMHFFVVDKNTQFWNSIKESGKVAFFAAEEFSVLEMRLYALKN